MSGRSSSAALEEGVKELAILLLRRYGAFNSYFESARLDLRSDNSNQRREDGHVDWCCDDIF